MFDIGDRDRAETAAVAETAAIAETAAASGDPLFVVALGGGYGHVARVAAACHTVGWTGPVTVAVSDPSLPGALAPRCRLVAPPRGIAVGRPPLGWWLAGLLARVRPREVWLDAFPAGVTGEVDRDVLGAAGPVPVRLLARWLRWEEYRRRLPRRPVRLATTWVTEPLAPAQWRWLSRHSDTLVPLLLRDPPFDGAAAAAAVLPERCWLVVHAGPVRELRVLVAAAAARLPDAVLVAVGPADPEVAGVTHRFVVPAAPLADRPEVAGVVTAGGAGSMRQYGPPGPRHLVVPLPRPLDDQLRRVRWHRRDPGPSPAGFSPGGVPTRR